MFSVALIGGPKLTAEDVVRHRLIGDIVKAYDRFDEQRQALRPIRK